MPWAGWRDVLERVWDELDDDHIGMLAGSVAFFAVLSVFPALVTLVSLYGLVSDPVDVSHHVNALSAAIPYRARMVLAEQLAQLVRAPGTGLSVSLFVSMALLLLSASSGVYALMEGINIAYGERQRRSYLKRRWRAFCVTVSFLLFSGLALFAITLLPRVLSLFGLGPASQWLVTVLRWPALGATVVIGLSFLYRYAPNRRPPRWQWVGWGAGLATAVWLLASMLLSLYVSVFGRLNATYGAIAGVVILMLWFYVSAYAVLFGAELNAELEHQTREDSTIGPWRPIGTRRALMADTLGRMRRRG